MTQMTQMVRHCRTCRDERSFDQPPCVDGHDGDCPEWVCSGCGSAVLVDTPTAEWGAVPEPAAA